MYTPVNPGFTLKKWGLRGSTLYRHVFVMCHKRRMRTCLNRILFVIGIHYYTSEYIVPQNYYVTNLDEINATSEQKTGHKTLTK